MTFWIWLGILAGVGVFGFGCWLVDLSAELKEKIDQENQDEWKTTVPDQRQVSQTREPGENR